MLTGFLSVNQNDSLLIHTLKEQLYHFALGSGKPLPDFDTRFYPKLLVADF